MKLIIAVAVASLAVTSESLNLHRLQKLTKPHKVEGHQTQLLDYERCQLDEDCTQGGQCYVIGKSDWQGWCVLDDDTENSNNMYLVSDLRKDAYIYDHKKTQNHKNQAHKSFIMTADRCEGDSDCTQEGFLCYSRHQDEYNGFCLTGDDTENMWRLTD